MVSNWIITCVLGLMPLVQNAQPSDVPAGDSKASADAGLETILVQLSHIDAEDAGQALRRLGYKVQAAHTDKNPNLMMLRGPQQELREIQKEVMPALDQPGTSAQSAAASVAYIPIAHQPSKNMMELLQTIAPPDGRTGYALDQARRMLVVRAAQSRIAEIQRLVETIDRPATALTLQFFFIRGDIGSAEAKRPSEMPAQLAGVAKTLLSNGLSNLSLLAPVLVNARDGEDFEAHARLGLAREGLETEPITLNLTGKASLLPDAQLVQLEVRANLDTGQMGSAFSTATTISAKLGGYTILAAAPGTTTDGNAVAVALRVTRDVE